VAVHPERVQEIYNNSDPAAIQQQAGSDISIDKIVAEWPVGTDPAVHVDAIEKLFASGAPIVNIHSGQADQKKVIDFYSASVIPSFRRT
jgi:F420-dependent hydroxymycolic acid dehydrogenase